MQKLPNDLQECILKFSNPSILLIHNGCEHCYIIKLNCCVIYLWYLFRRRIMSTGPQKYE